MKYFELSDDISYPNRWYLGDVLEVDNWELTNTVPTIFSSLKIVLERDGQEMDFTFTEAYGIPIVSSKVKEALDESFGITFVPVEVMNKH